MAYNESELENFYGNAIYFFNTGEYEKAEATLYVLYLRGFDDAESNLDNLLGRTIYRDIENDGDGGALAVEMLKKMASYGYASPMTFLGELYLEGRCVAEDHKEAVRLFEMAADKRWPDAMQDLATCYYNGYGVEVDHKRVCELLIKITDLDMWFDFILEDYLILAECFESGIGVEKDEAKALYWYYAAAFGGSIDSAIKLAKAYIDGRYTMNIYELFHFKKLITEFIESESPSENLDELARLLSLIDSMPIPNSAAEDPDE